MAKRRGHFSTQLNKAGTLAHRMVSAHQGLQEAERARLGGRLDVARSSCAAILKEFPDYVGALHTMGLVLADQSKYEDALGYLHRASMLNPEDFRILVALGGVYLRLGASRTAARTLHQACLINPDNVSALVSLAETYREEKEYELSKHTFERALNIEPNFSSAEIGLGLNLADMGEWKTAAEVFERRVSRGARDIATLSMLSLIPSPFLSVDLVELIKEAEPSKKQSSEDFRVQLSFVKAIIFDKVGQYTDAWLHVSEARRSTSAKAKSGWEATRRRFAPLLELVRKGSFQQKASKSQENSPISLFITGPSRSGKTTLEGLISNHPRVKRGYENPIVEKSVERTFQSAWLPTRSFLIELPEALIDDFQNNYTSEVLRRAEGAEVITNTTPLRIEDALRASSWIPNARFVFVRRDMYDQAIRIFMRNYRSGNYYANSLPSIFSYLEWCHNMLEAASEKMGDKVRVIDYEDMVCDPTSAYRTVADLCGIEDFGEPMVSVGDDRGCSGPYRAWIEDELKGKVE